MDYCWRPNTIASGVEDKITNITTHEELTTENKDNEVTIGRSVDL